APAGVSLVRVETAEQMRSAVISQPAEATIIIAAAAVADFRVRKVAERKIKRNGAITLELEPTADILQELSASRRPDQVLVGFAAETKDAVENGRAKLKRKNLDAIVINDV